MNVTFNNHHYRVVFSHEQLLTNGEAAVLRRKAKQHLIARKELATLFTHRTVCSIFLLPANQMLPQGAVPNYAAETKCHVLDNFDKAEGRERAFAWAVDMLAPTARQAFWQAWHDQNRVRQEVYVRDGVRYINLAPSAARSDNLDTLGYLTVRGEKIALRLNEDNKVIGISLAKE